MPIIPIIPSLNTCMSLQTTTTCTTTTTSCLSVPEVNTTQLQAFAEVCSSVSPAETIVSTISNAVMNSLVSSTKVITSSTIVNPIVATVSNLSIPDKIPVSSIPIPIMNIKQDSGEFFFLLFFFKEIWFSFCKFWICRFRLFTERTQKLNFAEFLSHLMQVPSDRQPYKTYRYFAPTIVLV